jgi:outer membrane cobalamin receptor
VSARASYTFLDSEIQAVDGADGQVPSPFVPGDRLLRRPRHQGSADLTWTLGRLQAFGLVEFRGATLDVEPNFGTFGGLFENEGHAVVTVGGSATLRTGVSVQVRVANLFDRDYEDTLGYPAWGRTAYVGVRLAARR